MEFRVYDLCDAMVSTPIFMKIHVSKDQNAPEAPPLAKRCESEHNPSRNQRMRPVSTFPKIRQFSRFSFLMLEISSLTHTFSHRPLSGRWHLNGRWHRPFASMYTMYHIIKRTNNLLINQRTKIIHVSPSSMYLTY